MGKKSKRKSKRLRASISKQTASEGQKNWALIPVHSLSIHPSIHPSHWCQNIMPKPLSDWYIRIANWGGLQWDTCYQVQLTSLLTSEELYFPMLVLLHLHASRGIGPPSLITHGCSATESKVSLCFGSA